MKIVSIVGARPQFIKVDAMDAIIKDNHIIIHTGQHYSSSMSDNIINFLRIKNKDIHNLNIRSCDYNYGKKISLMIQSIFNKLDILKPDYVFVYGDTDSTLAGSIATKKLDIPLVHIEAGLRSHNTQMIEEINRVITDQISDVLCCPTKLSCDNLSREGLKGNFVGDVMLDSMLHYSKNIASKSDNENYILATIHRKSNIETPDKINKIFDELNELGKWKKILFPIHPHTLKIQGKGNIKLSKYKNIKFIPPVNYIEMISLIKNCDRIVTDSGGLQKEAFFLKKLCGVVRSETEWQEIIDSGWSSLIEIEDINSLKCMRKPKNHNLSIFGDGNASKNILKLIRR